MQQPDKANYALTRNAATRTAVVQKLLAALQVMRRASSQEKYSGKNSYALRVSPGTDCAFIIAFCIVIDELFND